jgi:PPM family protein phosphatase
VHIDLEGPYSAESGDKFLICSDGLSGPVTDEEIGVILYCMDPDEATETLVDLANFRGGPDNISVVVAQVDGAVPPAAIAVQDVGDAPRPQRLPTAPLWLAAGAFLAILGYCLMHEYWPAAVGSALGFIAAVMAGLTLRSPLAATCPPIHSIGGPYGNGPYRKAKGAPNPEVVAIFAEIADKLHEQSKKDHGNRAPDWQSFETDRTEAAAFAEKGDYAEAIRRYGAAIRKIMKKFREHGRTTEDGAGSL